MKNLRTAQLDRHWTDCQRASVPLTADCTLVGNNSSFMALVGQWGWLMIPQSTCIVVGLKALVSDPQEVCISLQYLFFMNLLHCHKPPFAFHQKSTQVGWPSAVCCAQCLAGVDREWRRAGFPALPSPSPSLPVPPLATARRGDSRPGLGVSAGALSS